MLTYIILYIFLALLAIVSTNLPSKGQRILGIATMIIIVMFQGFRWRTGTDWEPYLGAFTKPNNATGYVEVGYLWANKIIGYFTDSYTLFLFIQCGFGLYSTYRFSRLCGVNNIAMMLLYSFACTIFPIRMTTAVSIYLFAYQYIVKRELIKYLLVSAIAISIHTASVVALPAYFLVNRHFKDLTIITVYVASCVFGLLSSVVFGGIMDISVLLYAYMGDFAQRKMEVYVVENQEENMLSIVSYLNALLFIIVFLYIRKKHFKESEVYNVLLNMYVLGIAFNRITNNTIPYFARTTSFFAAGFVVMLLLWIEMQYSVRRVILILLLTIYASFFYFAQVNKFSDLYIPYYSIFSEEQRLTVY